MADFHESLDKALGHTAPTGLPAPVTPPAAGEVAQVVLLDVTFAWFQEEVRARGLYLFPIPVGDDDLMTYGVGVGDALMGRRA